MLNIQQSNRRFAVAIASGLTASILIVLGVFVEASASVQSFI